MKFEEALAAMREGKRVKYVGANAHWFLRIKGCRIVNQEGNEFPLNSTSMVNYDWEIYEEPKWEPKLGEWCAEPAGVSHITEVGYHCRSDFGDTRPTKEQAEKARDKMRVFNRLLAYVDEHDPNYNPDKEWINWYVNFHREKKKWWADYCTYKTPGCVYMSAKVAKKLVDDLNSGRFEL